MHTSSPPWFLMKDSAKPNSAQGSKVQQLDLSSGNNLNSHVSPTRKSTEPEECGLTAWSLVGGRGVTGASTGVRVKAGAVCLPIQDTSSPPSWP